MLMGATQTGRGSGWGLEFQARDDRVLQKATANFSLFSDSGDI